MKTTFASIFLFASVFLLFQAEKSSADSTVVVQSSLLQTNLTSGGQSLDSSFTFELGCFKNNFVPLSTNTDDWLEDWVPLSDATGDPIPDATVPYDDSETGPPFPPGTLVNNFEMTVPFAHNTPPFNDTNKFYIWGFDNRTEDGAGQWILITDSTWTWPTVNPNELTSLTFAVADAATAVVGALNSGSVEMQTAAITVVDATLPPYELWLQTYFDEATLENEALMDSTWGVLADADNDEFSNIVEYYVGSSPMVGISKPSFVATIDEGNYVFQFNRTESAPGTNGHVEWSTDLLNWSTVGLVETIVPGEEGEETVINSIPLPTDGRIFMRLWVERVLEE